MESLITASARALAAGDPLGALNRIALRDDPPALALRGIAMAQLGEYPRARELLRRAARGFGAKETVARARCAVAEAEVTLAMRDFNGFPRSFAAASALLEQHGDHANAQQARLTEVRRLLLLGRLQEADAALTHVDTCSLRPSRPALTAVAELLSAELALRALRIEQARAAIDRAQHAANRAGVTALIGEITQAQTMLDRPAARCVSRNGDLPLRLDEVATLLASDILVVDGCRRGISTAGTWQSLARRPILFALARALAMAWPADVDREFLIAGVFRTSDPDETHRARLRVGIGRLRSILNAQAAVEATARGYVLKPQGGRAVVVLSPPIEGDQGAALALLSDGAAWSTSALALALDASQRNVQRTLAGLEAAGRVSSIGRGRTQRWLAPPLTRFTTILLLPAVLPGE